MEQIQKEVIETYNKNLNFLKQNHLKLYEKIELFNIGIDMGEVKLNFDLRYENNYFDIVDLNNNKFLYNQNSYDLSIKIIDDMSLDPTIDSFKTFYDTKTTDTMAYNALKSDIMIPHSLGNSPVINYVKNNLPKDQYFKDIPKFIAFGVLLGIHLPILQEKINSKVMLIVEPNLEIFRLSLFTVNYANLGDKTKLFLSVAENEFQFRHTFESFYGNFFIYNHYFKFLDIKNSTSINFYSKIIQDFLISQSHYLFSYERSFLTLYRTNSYINDGLKFINLNHPSISNFLKKPVLILGAGPSLQKKIDFVKEKREYFIIIAIYATLPLLEKNKIIPDIITQYDSQDLQVLNTLDKLQNKKFFDESIFIFSSHVNKKLINNFLKERVFIFQALYELKENFGILTSPSIGELTYAIALILGVKEIYLLGLDLALDFETGNSHIEGHSGASAFNKLKDLENSSYEQFTFRNHTILVKGNFLSEVKTVPVFKASINAFSDFCHLYKKSFQNVYNLSNGAYLYDTTPLNIENINFNSFEKLNMLHREEIFNKLEKISEIGYSEYDINNFDLKLLSIRKIKNEISNFLKTKHKDFEEYKSYLINLIQFIVFEKHNCRDLQNIILNYCFHNLHHIFYLFDISEEVNKKKFIYEINKNLFTQISKIINTYMISISYSINEYDLNMKKLDKFLIDYNIKETIYLEPLFNEIMETSKKGLFKEYKEDSIGFFGTLEVLSNKAFLKYVKEIIELIEDLEIKIFYFFDFQRTAFEQIFRKYINKIEFIKPQSFDDIKNNIKIWFEIQPKTESQKKITDLILNNCMNIYSCSFDENKYNVFRSNSNIKNIFIQDDSTILNQIKNKFILPNNNYFEFANNLKNEVLNTNPVENFLENYIGFLATKENLENNFIEKIISISVNFPNIKYSIFYFEDSDLLNFKNIFSSFIDKFKFIKLTSINDIINNCEIWVQADIRNQSFLHNRIFSYLNNFTFNIFPLILYKDFEIKNNKLDYLENLVVDFNQTYFVKTLNKKIDITKLQNTNFIEAIGFLATIDNLEDLEFIKFMNILFEKDFNIKYKAFYFSDEQKNIVLKVFDKYVSMIDFIKPNTIYNIVENISIYIHSSIPSTKPKSAIYHKIWQILNQTKANLFKIYLFDEIKNSNQYTTSLKLIDDSKIEFEKSVVSKIFENDYSYNEFRFINSINQPISEEIKGMCSPNRIGFLATKENLEDKEFIAYIKELMKEFHDIEFKEFCFNKTSNKTNSIEITTIYDITKNCCVLITNPQLINNQLDQIITQQQTKFQNVFISPLWKINMNKKVKDIVNTNLISTIKNNLEIFSLKENDVKDISNNHILMIRKVYEKLLEIDSIEKDVLLDLDFVELQFMYINLALCNKEFIKVQKHTNSILINLNK